MPMVAILATIIGISWGVYLTLYLPKSDIEKRRCIIVFTLCMLIFIGYTIYIIKYNAEIKWHISKFIDEGDILRKECATQKDIKNLTLRVSDWTNRMLNYLNSIDHSWASRVNSVTGQTYTHGYPEVNENIWNFLNLRIQKLDEILKDIK